MEQKKQRREMNIHFSSVVIGFLLALCLALALGAATGGEETGTYRISAASEMSVFVIDTQTGHTWRFSRTDMTDFGTPYARKSLRKSVTPMVY